MIARLIYLCLLLCGSAHAQGFAGLGTSAEGFALPDPEYQFSFPDDHGAHPAYRIEWWYLTATLSDADGRDFGIQWTLFRSALRPEDDQGWETPQVWMGHAGLTTEKRHYHAERLGRGGIGVAGVTTVPFRAFIDDWVMESTADAGDPLDEIVLRARGADFAYDLSMIATGPLVAHGTDGFSIKSQAGHASHYYSQPFYTVSGVLTLPEGDVEVTGQGWLDREWSSQPLDGDQSGWDWFALSFEDGSRLMAAAVRSGTDARFQFGTWIDPDGIATPLSGDALDILPLSIALVAEREIPVSWRVRLPERNLDVTTTALNPNSWMGTAFAYWEGPIRFSGTHSGRGYLEMTGYE